MELNELANIWKKSDHQLKESLVINKKLLKEVSTSRIKSYLGEFLLSNIIEICVNGAFSIYLLGFIIDNFMLYKYSVPAIFLWSVITGGFVFSIYKLYLYFSIDINYSVIQTQMNIEKFKYFERLDRNLLYVIIPLFSTAFLIVGAKIVFNFDMYVFDKWLLIFMAQSFIIAMIVVFFLKKFPDKNLQKASSFLEEIKEFDNSRE